MDYKFTLSEIGDDCLALQTSRYNQNAHCKGIMTAQITKRSNSQVLCEVADVCQALRTS